MRASFLPSLLTCLFFIERSSGEEPIPFHEGLAKGLFEMRCTAYSQAGITLRIVLKPEARAESFRVYPGTWIELNGYPRCGRLFFTFPGEGGTIKLPRHHIGREYKWIAIPESLSAEVPLVEKGKSPEIDIRQAGLDAEAGKRLSVGKYPTHDAILTKAATFLTMSHPDLSLEEFTEYVNRVFASRLSEKETKTKEKQEERSLSTVTWSPGPEHLKMAEHVNEKLRFMEAPEKNPGAGLTLADALTKGYLSAEAGKGVYALMILRLTRTRTAPPGPMHLSVPPGTVLSFDDRGNGEPAKLYPLFDGKIDLFGEISDGVQLPCINGSYKRRIKTRRMLPVAAAFDEKMGVLFQNRPESDRLSMAVEAVLYHHPELTPEQIQYHVTHVGVPSVEDYAISESLLATARSHLSGETTPATGSAVAAMSKKPASTPAPPAGPESSSSPPAGKPPEQLWGITQSAGEKGVKIDPNVPGVHHDQLKGAKNRKLLWREMVEHVPEYPESAVVGTWVSVPEAEARSYILQMRIHDMEAVAAAEGQSISPEIKQMIVANSELDQKVTFCYRGKLEFTPDGEVTGSYQGPNSNEPKPVKTRWRYDGLQTIDLNPSPTIGHLRFAANGRLVYHEDARSRILLVLKKQ